MDVNEHERLPNLNFGHKLKYRNSDFIAVLHLTVTVHRVFHDKHSLFSSCMLYRLGTDTSMKSGGVKLV